MNIDSYPTVAHPRRHIAIVATSLAVVVAACAAESASHDSAPADAVALNGLPVETETDTAARGFLLTAHMIEDAPNQTDESLRIENFKCGGEKEMTNTENFAYKVDFFTANEGNRELGKSYMDVLVTDETYGMGENAFKIAMDKGFMNQMTKKATAGHTTGNARLDRYIDHINSIELKEQKTYVSGDCRTEENKVTMPSPDIPVIKLGGEEGNAKKSTVEGIILPAEAIDEWKEAVTKDAEGNILFDIIPIMYETEDGKFIQAYIIVTAANGCDNQIRLPIIPPAETTPATSTTAAPGPNPTTTAPQQVSTSTSQPKTPSKQDDGKLPSDGTPAAKDPGTPDEAGQGPAGQPPDTAGYTPYETPPPSQAPTSTEPKPSTTAGTPPPPASTNPPPTSTNPPAPVTEPSTSLPPGPRPPKP